MNLPRNPEVESRKFRFGTLGNYKFDTSVLSEFKQNKTPDILTLLYVPI